MSHGIVIDPVSSDVAIGDRLLAEVEALLDSRSESDACQIAANAMAALLGAEQAVLWLRRSGRPKVEAIAGLANVERNIDFTHWFESLARHMLAVQSDVTEAVPEYFDDTYLQAERSIYLLEDALHARIVDDHGHTIGGLFVARAAPFDARDADILARYAKALARVCSGYRRRSWLARLGRRWWLPGWPTLLLAALVGAAFIPIRQSATGIVEVSARDAMPVTATQDGVIERVLVRPNQEVRSGTPLVRYDGAVVRSKLYVAHQNVGVAQADLERATGKAFGDDAARTELRMLRARVAEKAAETRYLEELARRLEIRATGNGIVIFGDAEEWAGRPVQSGERIMMLADPKRIWLTIYVPVDEVIPLQSSPEVKVNLDIAPLETITGKVIESSYEAVVMPDGRAAYMLRATLDQVDALPRIGLKGVARIYGERMPLGYLVVHKPLRSLRRTLGW